MSARSICLPLVLLSFANLAPAQVLVVHGDHVPPVLRPFEVPEVTIDATIREQVAQTQVTQVFKNPGPTTIEAEYLFPLPEEGTVQDMVLLVDGKELAGKILPKDEARRVYEEIVRKQRDPALLEYMGRGLFKASVFPIPAGQQRTVTLKATFICKRDRDLVQFVYPLATQKNTEKPIGQLKITARIESQAAIKNIYCPGHNVAIDRNGDHAATVKFEQNNSIPTGDFRLFYALQEGQFGASVLSYKSDDSEDGYFMLLASPSVKAADSKPVPKTVVITLDRSGSMAGKKIEQAREALKFVLNSLHEGDLFNVIAYDSTVQTFKPELQRYSSLVREEALRFVDNIAAGGSTNIDDALRTSLAMLQEKSRPSYVLFLTDGLPTTGETNELAIAANVKAENKVGARLFAFGVGYDANARLLDRLSGANGGTSEYVKPEDNLEEAVSRFYSRLSSPVLTNIAISFDGTDVNRSYPQTLPDLFEGGQLVWVGRYKKPGSAKVAITGKIGDESFRMSVDVNLASTASGGSYSFVERIWATRRIGTLIDELDLHGQNKELVDELVSLSKQYGILTPYTSFLADDSVKLTDAGGNRQKTMDNLKTLSEVEGRSGQAQRAIKQNFANAPGLYAMAPAPAAAAGSVSRFGGAVTAQDKDGAVQLVSNVRQIGSKSFFLKEGRWIESTLTHDDESKARLITQFSDEYFRLARAQTSELNQYLTMPEDVTVRLGEKVYRIQQAAK